MLAKITQATLNKMIVGSVFSVEDQMSARLDSIANIYSHQNCTPNNSPGKIMAIFVAKPHASTVFGALQYARNDMVLTALIIF